MSVHWISADTIRKYKTIITSSDTTRIIRSKFQLNSTNFNFEETFPFELIMLPMNANEHIHSTTCLHISTLHRIIILWGEECILNNGVRFFQVWLVDKRTIMGATRALVLLWRLPFWGCCAWLSSGLGSSHVEHWTRIGKNRHRSCKWSFQI